MGAFLFGVFIFAIYFLPTIVGYKHRNANSICLLNLFLGWTIIGWVVAMIWAVSAEKKESVVIRNNKSTSEEIRELKELLEQGTITNEEFENAKKQILNN